MHTPSVDNDLASIRQELNELRAEMSALRKNGRGHHDGLDVLNEPHVTDRRGMMKTMAGLAVGVATVGLLKPMTASAAWKNFPRTTGGNMIIGQFNSATNPADTTGLINPGSVLFPKLLQVDNYASASFSAPSNSIISLVGHVNDANATPTGQNLYGVYGQSIATTGFAYGVYGVAGTIAAPSGDGVTGVGSRGVVGVGSGNGCGVDGSVNSSATNAYGINGYASSGAGGAFGGGRAAIVLFAEPGAVADPNLAIPLGSGVGDLYRGSTNASLWYKAGGTNPYRRVADSTTAGALTAFAASSRFVNTITGSGGPYAGQHLGSGATAGYQIGGVTITGNTVPADARAIIGRIADPNPAGSNGALLVGATNPPVGGVISIIAGAPQNSFFISALDATGKVYVKNTSTGTTDVIIDIAGYYL